MATYTSLDDLDIPAIAARYGLPRPEASALKGGAANSSFRLDAGDGRIYVLSCLDNHDLASAAKLAEITRALAEAGVPTAHVIADRGGHDILELDERLLMLKEWIPGDVVEPLPADRLSTAGALLADLHNLPTAGLELPRATRRLSAAHEAEIVKFEDRDFADWLTAGLETVKQHEAAHHRTPVLAHGDLFPDNLIIGPDRSLSVIDWETVSIDDPLLDLGMAAVGLAQDAVGRLSPDRLELLLDGYRGLRPLSGEDCSELPTEITHAALIIAFHRFYRHNVRFPNPERATYHRAMVDLVDSIASAFP